MSTLFIDFETRSTVDIKKCGADVYARHPSTEVLCMGWALNDGAVQLFTPKENRKVHNLPFPTEAYTHVIKMGTVVAHNAAFELAIWNHVCVKKYGWPTLNPAQTVCTMAMAYAMSLPGALAYAAPASGLTIQKDTVGHRVMMQLSQPKSIDEKTGYVEWWEPWEVTDKFAQLHEYCKQDIEVERQLYHRLMKLSPDETRLWQLDYNINQRGIQIDVAAVKVAIEIVNAEKSRLDLEMREVTSGAVATCTASGQLTDWLKFKLGESVAGVAKNDVIDLLDNNFIPSECRAALLLRQEAAKSSNAKLDAMLRRVCEDGRIRSTTQYHGAGTGRWAGRGLQVQNFPRPKIKQEEIEGVFNVLAATR